MVKNKFFKVGIFLVVCIVLLTSFSVYASSKKMVSISKTEYDKLKSEVKSLNTKLTAKAKYIDAKVIKSDIYTDGSEESKGNSTIIYKGKVYLPVDSLSDFLNKEITWDGKKSAVYIGKKPAGNITYLDQMKTFSKYVDTWNDIQVEPFTSFESNTGEKYIHGLHSSDNWHINFDYEYLLNAKYKTFEGKIVPSSVWNTLSVNDDAAHINIYVDDNLVYSSGNIASNVLEPVDFSIDVTNAAKLRIEGLLDASGIVDAKLIY